MQAKYDGACQALPEGCLRVFLSVRIVSECVRQMKSNLYSSPMIKNVPITCENYAAE